MSRRNEYIEEEERSTDGSDSEGSLKDFIMGSEDEEEEEEASEKEEEVDETTLANELVEEFPFDKSLLEESKTEGPRRSRRARKAVTRYVDDRYAQLMYDDVELDKLSDSEGENAAVNDGNASEEDEDYVAASESEGGESDEEEEEEAPPPQKKKKKGDAKTKVALASSDPPVVVVAKKGKKKRSLAEANSGAASEAPKAPAAKKSK